MIKRMLSSKYQSSHPFKTDTFMVNNSTCSLVKLFDVHYRNKIVYTKGIKGWLWLEEGWWKYKFTSTSFGLCSMTEVNIGTSKSLTNTPVEIAVHLEKHASWNQKRDGEYIKFGKKNFSISVLLSSLSLKW